MLIGRIAASNPSINGQDLREEIDKELTKCHFTLLGYEEGDTTLLDELIGETMMYVIGQGINRRQRRGN